MKSKSEVRNSKEWKELRNAIKKVQKFDPITEKPIRKGANLHHLCLDAEQYDNLEPERFVLMNKNSHDLLHGVYGNGRIRKNWRKIVLNLIKLCKLMDKYNKEE